MQLDEFLNKAVASGHTDDECVRVIKALTAAASEITELVGRNGISGDLGGETGSLNGAGDSQKVLDVWAEDIIFGHLGGSGAAMLLSEERQEPMLIAPENSKGGESKGAGGLIVAVDPLDGSSNISVNVTIGTIFSILPAGPVLQPGRAQRAAGFFTYGPQTTLVLAFADGGGVTCFTRDPSSGGFIVMDGETRIPPQTNEYAINAAYANHWLPPVQDWMADILAGKSGPRRKDYRMRWVGALVAEAWRILRRGGVFLYPGVSRPGQEQGRLRLVYEANPIALLVERAGGLASHGTGPVLDLMPESLHQRTPFFFGAAEEVKRLEDKHASEG